MISIASFEANIQNLLANTSLIHHHHHNGYHDDEEEVAESKILWSGAEWGLKALTRCADLNATMESGSIIIIVRIVVIIIIIIIIVKIVIIIIISTIIMAKKFKMCVVLPIPKEHEHLFQTGFVDENVTTVLDGIRK